MKLIPPRVLKEYRDDHIEHYWICDGGLYEDHPEETVMVNPDFYEHNGTPVCTICDRDMIYDHTKVWESPKK